MLAGDVTILLISGVAAFSLLPTLLAQLNHPESFFVVVVVYSYVHTMFGSFLHPNPRPLPLPSYPFTSRQKLFCPYL
jgi:hypothetical protein